MRLSLSLGGTVMAAETKAYPAIAGLQGIDTDEKVNATKAKALAKAGISFVLRYLSRSEKPPSTDLTKNEADIILDSGLALMAVQHVKAGTWTPTEELGKTYGINAAAHASLCGLPAGTSVWLDLEEVEDDTDAGDVVAYCNAWFAQVKAAGYTTGIYIGSNCGLSGDDLYHKLTTERYWKSGSKVVDIPFRGYCMKQTVKKGDKLGGVKMCRDETSADAFGATPMLAGREVHRALFADLAIDVEVEADGLEATLRSLAKTHNLSEPMEALLRFRDQNDPSNTSRFWGIVNFELFSGNPRLTVFDTKNRSAQSYLCAHGEGSDPANTGYAKTFSDVTGSNCSSLGVYRCGEIYRSDKHRSVSMRLDGLQKSNLHARSRAVVVHGADYVSDAWVKKYGHIGRSDGCLAVDYRYVTDVVESLHHGSLILAWKGSMAAIEETEFEIEDVLSATEVWSEIELPDDRVEQTAEATYVDVAAQLAEEIVRMANDHRIVLARMHASGHEDSATARDNIVDTATGKAAKRSSYGSAPGGTVRLACSMLKGLLTLAEEFEIISVSELCGGEHNPGSRHYAGVAVDITSIKGQLVNIDNPFVTAFRKRCRELGATEVLGPGDKNHSTHVHAGWNRP